MSVSDENGRRQSWIIGFHPFSACAHVTSASGHSRCSMPHGGSSSGHSIDWVPGASRHRPIVAGAELAVGEAHLDAGLEFEPVGGNGHGRAAALVPATDARVAFAAVARYIPVEH